jgi:hypothetical protein
MTNHPRQRMQKKSQSCKTLLFSPPLLSYGISVVPTNLTGRFVVARMELSIVAIGLFSINLDGTKQYHPLVYALAPGEIELVALIALEFLKCAAMEVFGLTPRFRGGLISDHTEVFTNAFHEAFPSDMLLQCFPHIIRKFRIDGEREGNGSYFKHLSGKNPTSWLHDVAENDVYMLRECRTDAMFNVRYNERTCNQGMVGCKRGCSIIHFYQFVP